MVGVVAGGVAELPLARGPAAAVFAVPGSLSHEQLSLLLGIAQACRLKPLALVDSAVAAAAVAAHVLPWPPPPPCHPAKAARKVDPYS
jgi:hypothetical protein